MEITFLREVFETLGPSARQCYIHKTPMSLMKKLDGIKLICAGYKLDTISNLVHEQSASEASHKILLMRPLDERRVLSVSVIASVVIARICCKAWHVRLGEESRKMFELFSGSSHRILAGVLFEGAVHKAFLAHVNASSLPSEVRCLRRGGRSEKRYNFEMTTITAEAQIPAKPMYQAFPPGTDTITVEGGKYYQPTQYNLPTADSFFLNNSGGLTIVQSTIADEHSIKAIGLKALHKRLKGVKEATVQKPWRVIFVVPEGHCSNFSAWTDQEYWSDRLEVFALWLPLHKTQSEILRNAVDSEEPYY